MAQGRYIAVDLGAESGRVMCATVGTDGIALTEAHRFANGPVAVGKNLYWDILRLWSEIQVGIAKTVAAHGAADINGIGVDSWGVDFALLDGRGELLGNPVHYRDARTKGAPEKLYARLPREKVYALTGIQTLPFNTVFQLSAVAAENPQTLAAARHALFIPDLVNYWLCGRLANEYTIASTSQLLNARTRQWADEVLAAIQVPASLFHAPVMPGSVLGETFVEGRHGSTAGRRIPVLAVGSHDTASAVAAVPATGQDWLFLSSGTWSLLGVGVREPVLSTAAMQYNLTNEGTVDGQIRLLKNIAGLWPLQECRRTWAAAGQSWSYGELVELARTEPAHTARLDLDDPTLATPGDMPRKITDQCRRRGYPAPESPGRFVRVILESLAAEYARVKLMLEEVTGRKFTRLHIVGGGSQNDLLNQFAADATGLQVRTGPVEATAIGNVLAQAVATGRMGSLTAGRELVAKTASIRVYEPHDTESWQAWAAEPSAPRSSG